MDIPGRSQFEWHTAGRWIGDSLLKHHLPHLLAISTSPNGSVLDLSDNQLFSWFLVFRRHLKDDEIIALQSLLGILIIKKLALLKTQGSGLYIQLVCSW